MKATNDFERVIQAHLEGLAANDELFAESLKNENKSITDCCTYIVNQAQKSGHAGFTDDEIFGMAVHYYNESDLDVGKPVPNVRIITNHVVEITEEEKEAARKEALERIVRDEQERLKKKSVKKSTPAPVVVAAEAKDEKKPAPAVGVQQSLF